MAMVVLNPDLKKKKKKIKSNQKVRIDQMTNFAKINHDNLNICLYIYIFTAIATCLVERNF